jgi:hypothetical protein
MATSSDLLSNLEQRALTILLPRRQLQEGRQAFVLLSIG